MTATCKALGVLDGYEDRNPRKVGSSVDISEEWLTWARHEEAVRTGYCIWVSRRRPMRGRHDC